MNENAIQVAMSTQPPTQQMVNIDILSNPKVNKDILKDKIIHNIEMSDDELSILLKESYADILSCIFDMNDYKYLDFVTTARFINTLISIIATQRQINHNTRMHINKLVYDFITYHPLNADTDYITQLMVKLANQVNDDLTRNLMALGISAELASFLALARFSSANEAINIRRVNFIICTNLSKEFNMDNDDERSKAEFLVIELYKKFFNKLTILFEATMFDVYNVDESWVTDEISEMYSITTLALLDILNNMTYPEIRAVLMSYCADYVNLHKKEGYGTRVSLNTLSGDYSRIVDIVEGLRTENIYVP